MRTTLNIEEEALAYAKERARLTGQSVGAVVSAVLLEAARLQAPGIAMTEAGLPYLPARKGARKVTSAQVAEALEREEVEKHAPARR